MDNKSNDADIKFKAFLIVLSVFIGFYYIVLLICLLCKVKYAGVFMIWITIGIAVSMALSGILYGIRANYPENKLTFQKAVEKTILVGIYFGITCGLLYILSKYYGYNLELLVMSAILLAGILASIGTSIPWQSITGIGIVFISVLLKWSYLKIKKVLEERRARKQQEEREQQYQ
jgi:MFS family permease